MTNSQVAKRLNNKRFYSDTFGDFILIKDCVVYCDDSRVEIINDKTTLRSLVFESGVIL